MNKALRKGNHKGCPYVPLASLGRPRPHRAARSLGEMNPRRNGNPKGSAPQPQPISEGCPYTPAARLGSIVGAALVAALSDMGSAQ